MRHPGYADELHELLGETLESARDRQSRTFEAMTAPYSTSLVLFGAGNLGRKTARGLRSIGLEPLAFTDNNRDLWGKHVDGIPVLDPASAAQQFRDKAAFVITIWRALGNDRYAERLQQLRDLNIPRIAPFAALFWKHPEVFLPHFSLDSPETLLSQAQDVKRCLDLWEDDQSRNIYTSIIRWRMRLDFDGLPRPAAHEQYFADDLFSLISGEVFVDCGAFDGDTIRGIFKRQTAVGQIYAFEPDPANYWKLCEYLDHQEAPIRAKVAPARTAVSRKRGNVRFNAMGTVASSITDSGSVEVACAPIDELLGGTLPTFIKMDIEGAELDALAGARRSIEEGHPLLAITVYHKPDHLWSVPLYIHSLCADYRFFLRPHDHECWDLVCYAVPVHRLARMGR